MGSNNITGTGFITTDRFDGASSSPDTGAADTSQAKQQADQAKASITTSVDTGTSSSNDAILSQVDGLLYTSDPNASELTDDTNPDAPPLLVDDADTTEPEGPFPVSPNPIDDGAEGPVPIVNKEQYPTSLDGIKGLSGNSMKQIAKTDRMIQNQLAKYEKMAQNNDAPEIKRKIAFWKHEQNLQEKIKARLKKPGLAGEHLKKTFTNFFNARTKLLVSKAKQGPYAENKGKFYEHMEKNTAVLTQLASGSSWKQVQSNMHIVDAAAKKVGNRHEAVEKITDSINTFRKELNKKDLSPKRRDTIKAKLKELHEQRNEQRTIKGQLLRIIRQFGGRSHKLTGVEKDQYAEALRDIEALKGGNVALDQLP